MLIWAGLVAVAHAWLSDQPAGAGRVRFQLAAQLGHVQPQVAGRVGITRSPHLGEQLVAAEQLARVAEQHLEQVPLGRGQPDILGSRGRVTGRDRHLPGDPLGGQVDDQVTELHPRHVLGRGPGPAGYRAHPRQQLFDPERLGDVIIGARVQRLDLVAAAVAAGQHDDRGLGPAAQPLDHLDTVQIGQTQVEDHQIRWVAGGGGKRFGAGGRHVHVEFADPQVYPQRPENLRLVVDDQHPGHDTSPAPARSRWPGV